MNIAKFSVNNIFNAPFSKMQAPDTLTLKKAQNIAHEALGGLDTELLTSIQKHSPELIENADGIAYIKPDGIKRKIVTSIKCFFGMPLDILNSAAAKFPNSKLYNSNLLKQHRQNVQFEDEIKALQGIQKKCTAEGVSLSEAIIDFNESLNSSMADNIANYDVKKERFATRLVSGFTAAMFLGNDFYNKAIQKGKTEEEAKKDQRLKQGQEVKENICEAITQFAVFACFSTLINKSPWASAIIGAGIGFVSRIISRLSSGMPLGRIKVEEKAEDPSKAVEKFAKLVKGESEEVKNSTGVEKSEEKKKPVLSLKNILMFCALSIAGGYALRFGKDHTKAGKKIAEILQKHTDKFNQKTIQTVTADSKTLEKLGNILKTNGENILGDKIEKIAKTADKIDLGTDFRTKKILGAQVRTRDLKSLKTAPFRFIKELISYPYKIANKLETAIKNSRLKAMDLEIPKAPSLTKDKYEIMNLYKRFVELEEKYKGNDAKLAEEFGKYVKKMRLISNNEATSSKGDTSKIAVIAQTLGTLTGMWFNMNDEFNSSVKNGSTKEEAEKDARLRGINKFFRMTVQVIISGALNAIFVKQYNGSIAKAAGVVAASTVLTDGASRLLSGMPTKKMTKEELDKYQKDHKEGFMSWYYKLIDKLAS